MKLKLQEVVNSFAIKKLLQHDGISDAVVLDTPMELWEPNPKSIYFCVWRDDAPTGVLILERFSSNAVMFHGGIFKEQRHKNSDLFMKELYKEIKNISNNKQIFTTILTTNEPALKLIKKSGLKELCVLTKASVKGDMILLSE